MNNVAKFRDYFGVSLAPYWDRLFGFDIVKFSEEFIKPSFEESLEDAIKAKYGDEACEFIYEILKDIPISKMYQ